MIELRAFSGWRALLLGAAREPLQCQGAALLLLLGGMEGGSGYLTDLALACALGGLALWLCNVLRCLPLRTAADGSFRAGLRRTSSADCLYVVIFQECVGRYRTVLQTARSTIWIAGHTGTGADAERAVRLARMLGIPAYAEHADGERLHLSLPD